MNAEKKIKSQSKLENSHTHGTQIRNHRRHEVHYPPCLQIILNLIDRAQGIVGFDKSGEDKYSRQQKTADIHPYNNRNMCVSIHQIPV